MHCFAELSIFLDPFPQRLMSDNISVSFALNVVGVPFFNARRVKYERNLLKSDKKIIVFPRNIPMLFFLGSFEKLKAKWNSEIVALFPREQPTERALLAEDAFPRQFLGRI